MDLLLILTYAGLCIAIFKIFKIPLNKWTVPTAVLGGIVIIGALLLLMNYNHPYSEVTRNYYVTTPIYSEVRARVVEVPVEMNQTVSEGDILFKLDPQSFEDEIRGFEAELVAANKDLERAQQLLKKGVGSEREVDLNQANVDSLLSRLEEARFNLDQTTVRAPGEGIISQLALRPGMMALPMRPLMTFTHEEEGLVVGWFRQNSMLRLKKGDEAEVVFDAVPGRIFKGEVSHVFPVIGEGQIQPNGEFMRFAQQRMPGRVSVGIKITDTDFPDFQLPKGSYAQSAVYTEHFSHIGVMRRILLRMSAWMNYVFPLH
jgi:multidrug resistance efflux pump